MKEFNLEDFKKKPSQKVVTRHGRSVRIVCTDYKGEQPIIALIAKGEKEDIHLFYKDGRWSFTNENCLDLFFAPEKKEGWVNIYRSDNDTKRNVGKVYPSEKEAKEAIKGDPEFITTIKIEWEE